MDSDLNVATIPCEGLVNRVVYNFKDTVVEPAFIGIADVHVGSFSDPFKSLQFFDLGGIVTIVVWYLRRIGNFVFHSLSSM
ncbi:MAG: hypothetical protein BWY82_00861 [Verrucomicrobia bacterium ADurb.Bin474]|nr:MAG: hypothetical protein BWY82_00861 [Verrucomicrobia bacterium ADurb.Bin474]